MVRHSDSGLGGLRGLGSIPRNGQIFPLTGLS